MSILSNIFKKKDETSDGHRIGGLEDFMTLIRVYFQSTMAANLGITNLAMLPDLRVFKQTLHVPTLNNRLGHGEKIRCRKMLTELYDMDESFFREIDSSIKQHCRSINDVRNYLFLFQGFSQDLLMLMGNVMKWKFRMPSFFKGTIKAMTQRAISDIMTRNTWKDDGVRNACVSIRKYQHALGYSQEWMTEYVFRLVMLAKKEPKPKDVDTGEKK
jgi:hypothetical protein